MKRISDKRLIEELKNVRECLDRQEFMTAEGLLVLIIDDLTDNRDVT